MNSLGKVYLIWLIFLISGVIIQAQSPREIIDLNGMAEFEQSETAFPPEKFTRTIQVPGLIDLAEPEIEQYEKYFTGTADRAGRVPYRHEQDL